MSLAEKAGLGREGTRGPDRYELQPIDDRRDYQGQGRLSFDRNLTKLVSLTNPGTPVKSPNKVNGAICFFLCSIRISRA